MSRIILLPGVEADFERIRAHLRQHDTSDMQGRIAGIVQAIDVLADNPFIGRELEHGKRELVIGRGARGCVALYRYVEPMNAVIILAIRAQREAGYAR
ncbi:MAG: type II toxin-antitoxin system RelE/ParE family toxin [Luteimonas sp.]|nr:type II toxin-antitoxin system RelE/ParE family toxin [Luteimonas sp.]